MRISLTERERQAELLAKQTRKPMKAPQSSKKGAASVASSSPFKSHKTSSVDQLLATVEQGDSKSGTAAIAAADEQDDDQEAPQVPTFHVLNTPDNFIPYRAIGQALRSFGYSELRALKHSEFTRELEQVRF